MQNSSLTPPTLLLRQRTDIPTIRSFARDGEIKIQPAILSIHLDISNQSEEDFQQRTQAITSLSNFGTNLKNININLNQGNKHSIRGCRIASECAQDDEERWTELLGCLDQLAKLDLKTATFVISDEGLETRWFGFDWEIYRQSESKFRCTLEQKRAWA